MYTCSTQSKLHHLLVFIIVHRLFPFHVLIHYTGYPGDCLWLSCSSYSDPLPAYKHAFGCTRQTCSLNSYAAWVLSTSYDVRHTREEGIFKKTYPKNWPDDKSVGVFWINNGYRRAQLPVGSATSGQVVLGCIQKAS